MRISPSRALLLCCLGSLLTRSAFADTLTVGPGKQHPAPCAAIAVAQPNDVIEIDAGSYPGDMCAVPVNGLTLRGVNGRAVLDGQGDAYGGKGIWVIGGNDVTVENIEFMNAFVSEDEGKNGAGIRFEGVNLTVRNSYFHDNQNGILTGNTETSTVILEHCEFAQNGHGDGQSHNMYIGHSKRFELRYSYTHDAKIGHLVKSRANENVIEYNRITGEAGTDSYEIDLPSAGNSLVIGNVIEQGQNTDNPALLAYGEEQTGRNAGHDLYVVNNTFVNHLGSGTFVSLDPATYDGIAKLVNNVFTGGGTVSQRVDVENVGSCMDAPAFVDEAGFDFHLTDGSPCKDHGVAPGAAGDLSLVPTSQYVHPLSFEGRVAVGAFDSGAFEVGGAVPPGGSTSSSSSSGAAGGSSGSASGGFGGSSGTVGDGGSSGAAGADGAADASDADDGGCGCHSAPRNGVSALAFGWLALLFVRRRSVRRSL